MNPRLNKKVKKFLDAYFKGTSASSPERITQSCLF